MAITSESIRKRNKDLEEHIRLLSAEIRKTENTIDENQKMLEKVIEYENRPEEQKRLYHYIDSTTSTVRIMDEFESLTPEEYYKYDRLILRYSIFFNIDSFGYIIERRNGRSCVGDVTMTAIKKREDWDLRVYAKKEIESYYKNKKVKNIEFGTVILFTEPYHLRAQNSTNRTGYGNYYEGYELISEGTLYGETTDYLVVGVLAM